MVVVVVVVVIVVVVVCVYVCVCVEGGGGSDFLYTCTYGKVVKNGPFWLFSPLKGFKYHIYPHINIIYLNAPQK